MKSQLEDILERVRKGTLSPRQAMDALKDYPYEDLDFAKIDHHREIRKGFPEVIYGLGKTDEQIVRIAKAIVSKGASLLVTRIEAATFAKLKRSIPQRLWPYRLPQEAPRPARKGQDLHPDGRNLRHGRGRGGFRHLPDAGQ
jgi:NCAIR mutase (PurE)-related protein